MDIAIDIFRVFHIISAVLMAWPFYALVAVNQRALLGPPLGDRTDTYIENIIKNRTVPCFVFQATVFISGLALVFLQGFSLDILITNKLLGVKFVLLLFIVCLLTYVHIVLQPRINAHFTELPNYTVTTEITQRILSLRLRRKQVASVCLFCVLTMAMLGVQVWAAFPVWLTGVFALAIAAFTWRAYKSITPYGWF